MRTSMHATDATTPIVPTATPPAPAAVLCDVCGSTQVQELRCKVICRNCGTILQSCADL